jgi:hypothetical protein
VDGEVDLREHHPGHPGPGQRDGPRPYSGGQQRAGQRQRDEDDGQRGAQRAGRRRVVPPGQPDRHPGQPRPQGQPAGEGEGGDRAEREVRGGHAGQREPTAASSAPRIATSGAGCPVISSTWAVACQNSTSRPPTTVPPASVTAVASGVGQGS